METNKAISVLQKQNDGMYFGLSTKNIPFERTHIPEMVNDEDHLKLLQEENSRLKEVINANKPPPQPKQEKKKSDNSINKKETKTKDNEDGINSNRKDNENDEDETFEEPVKKFDTIMNMEELKRAFFNKDYMVFEEQIKSNSLKFYKVGYKYNSDKDGAPDFSAKNLLKGFVRNFDDYRKYFMICFRCWKNQHEIKYKYDSYWIVNTNEHIHNVIGSMAEDFDFFETSDIDDFISQIKKLPETDEPVWINEYSCIGESYVH